MKTLTSELCVYTTSVQIVKKAFGKQRLTAECVLFTLQPYNAKFVPVDRFMLFIQK